MRRKYLIVAILAIQALCSLFFVSDILLSLFGVYLHPIPWQTREYLEICAALGLILGFILGAIALHRTIKDRHRAELGLQRARENFKLLLDEKLTEWQLTPAEKDVALFAIKGLTTQEIANLRNTSEGTVKAQTNAIYRKANVTGRPQLLSLFIEDLLMDGTRPAEADQSQSAA
ncbi:MAG: helix-turn-helix transcriptional regulator [Paracoccaceae bacterium]|nr:helix-turn-helix transcriptional regulator [Paracoccaceae bacterium]MDH5530924.1 helix-turn-helix transcriptional regulator [Paracoccaceae bacterium]